MRHIWWFLVPALLSLVAPAQARPRDDALSGAIRCGAIADSRQWLDWYYGAAQPMRAALGLAPALAAQVQLAASPPAGGQPRDEAVRAEVVAVAAGCMREPGDRPWLDCYYAAATPMRVQLGLSAPQGVIRPAPAPIQQFAPAPAQQFASAAPAPAKPAGPPPKPRTGSIFTGIFNNAKPVVRDMPMASYIFAKNGAFTVTLQDGQVWEQSPEDEVYHPARWRGEASEYEVTIVPAPMRTFTMTVNGYMHKVRRVR
jgi:hypothetical protein